eukprot:1924959-Rhodomonas_salina.3
MPGNRRWYRGARKRDRRGTKPMAKRIAKTHSSQTPKASQPKAEVKQQMMETVTPRQSTRFAWPKRSSTPLTTSAEQEIPAGNDEMKKMSHGHRKRMS